MSNSLLEELNRLLEEKCVILERIKAFNEGFIEECKNSVGFEQIDQYIEEKDEFINEIDSINVCADELLQLANDTLDKNSIDEASAQSLKEKAERIDILCVEIGKLEEECKSATDKFIMDNREKIAEDRKSNKVAQNYYKVQNNIGIADAQFMDDKK